MFKKMERRKSCEKKVGVVVRVRPMLEDTDQLWVHVADETRIQTINHRNTQETLEYEFEHVFGPEASQMAMYSQVVKPMMQHVLKGQNCSIFAYGPTGAGKTHTMLGTEEQPGIIPRCVRKLFSTVQSQDKVADPGDSPQAWDTRISFSYLEIYNEKVQDLLNPRVVELPIRMDSNKQIVVAGLTEQPIDTLQQFNELFAPASNNRMTAATKLNERSSRSHSILLLKVQRTQKLAPFRKLCGKLYLIDLAGSEDNRRTGNQGIRLKESGAINNSLLALGKVVDALNKGQACVPYRDSKLTRLLQDSLGGGSHATMIVNLAPGQSYYYDTFTTLTFARKAKKIVNTIRTNETTEQPIFTHRNNKRKSSAMEAECSSTTPDPPAKKPQPDPISFLSPLIRNQERFKAELRDEMMGRLEALEDRLMSQMHEATLSLNTTVIPPQPSCSQHDSEVVLVSSADSTMEDDESKPRDPKAVLGKLESLMTQLEQAKQPAPLEKKNDEIGSSMENEPESSLSHRKPKSPLPLASISNKRVSTLRATPRRRSVCSASSSDVRATPSRVTSDVVHTAAVRRSARKIQPHTKATKAAVKGKVFSDGSALAPLSGQLGEVTSSPLFFMPSVIRKKGFKSTASKSKLTLEPDTKENKEPAASLPVAVTDSTVVVDSKHGVKSSCHNPDLQRAHNGRILSLLNTGTMKDLTSLQTIGAKRAQLIYDYRQLNGYYEEFKDLRSVPGITKPAWEKFLRGNLVDLNV